MYHYQNSRGKRFLYLLAVSNVFINWLADYKRLDHPGLDKQNSNQFYFI